MKADIVCGDRFFFITVAASIFMPHPPAELELQTNFNAISKNVKELLGNVCTETK